MIFSLVLFLFSSNSLSLAAVNGTQPPPVSSYIVSNLPDSTMMKIASFLEISRRRGNSFEVLVPANKRQLFLSLAPQSRLLLEDISAPVRASYIASRRNVSNSPRYHSFTEVVDILKSSAQAHSDITELVKYGDSKQGKPLFALRVSSHIHDGKKVPRIMLTAATHGDEIITTEVLLALLNEMMEGAKSNPRFAKILDQEEIVFIPTLNPDGFESKDRYDNGADPNRSYPYPKSPSAVPTASIAGIMAFVAAYPVAGSIDFHAYSSLIMYPWAYTKDAVPASDEEVFKRVTGKMAATNGYQPGQISKIIYVAPGSSADFYYWKYHTMALGIEMGSSKSPSPSEFPKYIKEQEESTWLFLEAFGK